MVTFFATIVLKFWSLSLIKVLPNDLIPKFIRVKIYILKRVRSVEFFTSAYIE